MNTLILAKTVLFRDDRRVLIMRRALDMPYRPGELDVPGGKIEPGEDIIDGAIREIQEETGIRLKPDQMKLVFADSGLRLDKPAAWLFFVAHLKDPKITMSSEHTQMHWLTLDEAITQMEDDRQRRLLQFILDHQLLS